jgi:putative nucleotidyltransferase with HDIG domain
MLNHPLMQKLYELEALPTLPQVMEQILETIDDEKSSTGDLTSILECDQAISAQVLRLANSAYYGLPSRVDTIRRAVVLMGFDTVRLLTLATSVIHSFSKKNQKTLDPSDFWMHSFGTAKAAELMVQRYPRLGLTAGACFTGGLLHDIGKYILALAEKDTYNTVYEEAQASSRLIRDVEREHFNTDHAEVGGWVSENWRFPPAIIAMIRDFYKTTDSSGAYVGERRVAHLADRVARLAGFGWAGDPTLLPIAANTANSLGLRHEDVLYLVEKAQESREKTRELLNLITN